MRHASELQNNKKCTRAYTRINQAAKLEAYPSPKIEDLFVSLTGGIAYSKLDLSHAYQQLELQEELRPYRGMSQLIHTKACFSKLGFHLEFCLHRQSFRGQWRTSCKAWSVWWSIWMIFSLQDELRRNTSPTWMRSCGDCKRQECI